ncbi:hypothetical protein FOZ62_027009 [Perkinsus olseni]|uniref:Rab-GAP TBC domain-containing protein n=1 Tax=Perkinsus olseni TaxID=32597 RepID=A0A7J6N5Q3_PEROL|nr:hypothetical protein FOZ62_027009 [Perkinsus olseni]
MSPPRRRHYAAVDDSSDSTTASPKAEVPPYEALLRGSSRASHAAMGPGTLKKRRQQQVGQGQTLRSKDSLLLQIQRIFRALAAEPVIDLHELQVLAHSPFGFVNSSIRRSVWSALLGLSAVAESSPARQEEGELPSLQEVEKSYPVISRDVARSGNSWRGQGSAVRLSIRKRKQRALAAVLVDVVGRHEGHLHYYQGLHDIALALLEVEPSTSRCCAMLDRLCLFYLSDLCFYPFQYALLPGLDLSFVLLQALDPDLYQALCKADIQSPHLAVPWVLTWMAHNLPTLEMSQRLMDSLLSSHPAVIYYYVACLLIMNRDDILQVEPFDMPHVHQFCQNLPSTLDMPSLERLIDMVWLCVRDVFPLPRLLRLKAAQRMPRCSCIFSKRLLCQVADEKERDNIQKRRAKELVRDQRRFVTPPPRGKGSKCFGFTTDMRKAVPVAAGCLGAIVCAAAAVLWATTTTPSRDQVITSPRAMVFVLAPMPETASVGSSKTVDEGSLEDTFKALDKRCREVPVLCKLSGLLGVEPGLLISVLFAVVSGGLLVGWGAFVISTAVAVVNPARRSMKAIREFEADPEHNGKQLERWLQYWVCLGGILLVESISLSTLLFHFPLWYICKVATSYRLMYPRGCCCPFAGAHVVVRAEWCCTSGSETLQEGVASRSTQ